MREVPRVCQRCCTHPKKLFVTKEIIFELLKLATGSMLTFVCGYSQADRGYSLRKKCLDDKDHEHEIDPEKLKTTKQVGYFPRAKFHFLW